jgi:hypothetical protein
MGNFCFDILLVILLGLFHGPHQPLWKQSFKKIIMDLNTLDKIKETPLTFLNYALCICTKSYECVYPDLGRGLVENFTGHYIFFHHTQGRDYYPISPRRGLMLKWEHLTRTPTLFDHRAHVFKLQGPFPMTQQCLLIYHTLPGFLATLSAFSSLQNKMFSSYFLQHSL